MARATITASANTQAVTVQTHGPLAQNMMLKASAAMMYAETRNMTPYGSDGIANKTQNFEAVAQYQFDFGLRPSLAWVYSKGIDLGGNDYHPRNGYDYVDRDLVNYIDRA